MGNRQGTGISFIGAGQSDVSLMPSHEGGAAAGLARLDRLGFRVPPALVIDAAVTVEYFRDGTLPPGFRSQLESALRRLEHATGLTIGPSGSLLVAVRSSPAVAMPGVLDAITNVGLSESGIPAFIRRTGDPWLVWDAYRRLVRAFAHAVRGLTRTPFDRLEARYLRKAGAQQLNELDALTLRDVARRAEARLARMTGADLPVDPVTQIMQAIEAVLRSWHAPRARDFRRLNGLPDAGGMTVLVQAMAFGTAAGRSGTGVLFTRDPGTGDDTVYADFLFKAQGDDLASGRTRVRDTTRLPILMPHVWRDLLEARRRVERECRDMQELEFAVEDSQLYFLGTKPGDRTPWAALQIAGDLVDAGIIDETEAVERVAPYDLNGVTRTRLVPHAAFSTIARGTPAGPGVATGTLVFDAARARRRARDGAVILLREALTAEDVTGMSAASGAVSVLGGRTCHAAMAARQLGKVCVVDCASLRVDESARSCLTATSTLQEGDIVTVDGESGCLYAGALDAIAERPLSALARVEGWHAALGTRARITGASGVVV